MDSSMIGKIEKAKRYAEEAGDRVAFDSFHATIKGDNSDHLVTFQNGSWTCDCHHFHTSGLCSHTMAIERVLRGMIPQREGARPAAA